MPNTRLDGAAIAFGRYTHAQRVRLELAQLPCWAGIGAVDYRDRLDALVGEIEAAARAQFNREGKHPMGAKRILRQHPHDAPSSPSRSPAPRFHAATAMMRKALELAFYDFRVRYRQAAEDLRAGRANVEFPPGSFPPRLPFQAIENLT